MGGNCLAKYLLRAAEKAVSASLLYVSTAPCKIQEWQHAIVTTALRRWSQGGSEAPLPPRSSTIHELQGQWEIMFQFKTKIKSDSGWQPQVHFRQQNETVPLTSLLLLIMLPFPVSDSKIHRHRNAHCTGIFTVSSRHGIKLHAGEKYPWKCAHWNYTEGKSEG